jgi:Lon protease-like protein
VTIRMPMFPLQSVVFPHTALPLRVFEARYQHLIDDVSAGDRTFGTVLIEKGSEVGGGDERFDVGTALRIASISRLPESDHRRVIAAAVWRLRISRWVAEEPYPMADVEPWPDEPEDVPPALLDEAESAIRRVLALASELGADTSAIRVDLATDPLTASYQIAALAPVDPLDALALLSSSGPASRLLLCLELLDGVADSLRDRLGG